MSETNTMTALTSYAFENHPVRITDRDGSPWFVAADVCKAIHINNSRQAVARLDEDEVSTVILADAGKNGKMIPHKTNIVSESGLYALILRSDKPEAKVFRKWVTSEVLPSIRRRGVYDACENALPAAPEKLPLVETIIDMLRSLNERITAKENVPAHILKYAWNLANVTRDVSIQCSARGLLDGYSSADEQMLAMKYEQMLANAIDEATPLPGMPFLASECDRIFIRSGAVVSIIGEEQSKGKWSVMSRIRDLACAGYLERISKIIYKYPHRNNSAIRRLNGIMWNPNEKTPVRVLDVLDGKIIEIKEN